MKIFKQTLATFEKLPFTQVLFAEAETMPEGDGWVEDSEAGIFEIEMEFVYEAKHLYTQAGVRYFGWL